MKTLLAVASAGEGLTGLALLVCPMLVIRLLFGCQVAGVGIVICRVGGIILIALGVSCWPGGRTLRAVEGMFAYSTAVAEYLAGLGIGGVWAGKLLWPAVAVHGVLSLLLARAWFAARVTTH